MAAKKVTRSQVVVVRGQIVWQAHHDLDTGAWIGVCKPLNLNAVGETYAEMQQTASEAMALLFTDLFEDGELERFLRKNNWHTGPMPVGATAPQFDVPAEWKINRRYAQLVG